MANSVGVAAPDRAMNALASKGARTPGEPVGSSRQPHWRPMPELLEPPPQPSDAKDRALTAAKVGLNLVPFIGGSAAELVQAVVGPRLTRRGDRWQQEVAEAIRHLQRQHVPVDSDEFVTAVVQASRIALGTHLDEKLDMLKAAIIHCALPDRPMDIIAARYLRLVDELDPSHFAVLAFLRNPKGHFDRLGLSTPHDSSFNPEDMLPRLQLPVSGEELDLVMSDLMDRGLAVNIPPGTGSSLYASKAVQMLGQEDQSTRPRSSALGDRLLDFVTYIEPPDEAQPGPHRT